MKTIHQVHPQDFKNYSTETIRERFLLQGLVQAGHLHWTYSHYDRMMIGAAFPADKDLRLETLPALRADSFLERREIGIVNIGGPGSISVDGKRFEMGRQECLYIGKGAGEVIFSAGSASDGKYILFSCPAHQPYPTVKMTPAEADPSELGSLENNNHRVINRYIHINGIQSCQLVLGVTNFRKGSVWNTMPPHTHDRRMETYFYFDLPTDQRVFHFMGTPEETRHIVLSNEEAVLSPSWSIHSGVATANYSFIWAMAGENLEFTDMDAIPLNHLR